MKENNKIKIDETISQKEKFFKFLESFAINYSMIYSKKTKNNFPIFYANLISNLRSDLPDYLFSDLSSLLILYLNLFLNLFFFIEKMFKFFYFILYQFNYFLIYYL